MFNHSVLSDSSDPLWTAKGQASLFFTKCYSWLKLMPIESVMPFNHLILCHSLLLLPSVFPSIKVFSRVGFLHQVGKGPELQQVFPMSCQDLFPLGWTGSISLQSKGLSRVFSNTIVQNISSSTLRVLYGPTLTSIHDYWKKHSFD